MLLDTSKHVLGINIRPAVLQDLEQILQIEQESFSSPWTKSMFEVEITNNPFSYLFIGCIEDLSRNRDVVVSYICYWIVFSELRILNLAVKSSVRRQGVSQRMVRLALLDAHSKGATNALLEVRASNIAAKNLYSGFRFKEYGKRLSYYTNPNEDAILMHLHELDKFREF